MPSHTWRALAFTEEKGPIYIAVQKNLFGRHSANFAVKPFMGKHFNIVGGNKASATVLLSLEPVDVILVIDNLKEGRAEEVNGPSGAPTPARVTGRGLSAVDNFGAPSSI